MAKPILHIATPADAQPEPPAERIRRLQDEARELALEHLTQLQAALSSVQRLAEAVTGFGDACPVGASELAKRLAEEATRHGFALKSIIERTTP